jgi:thiol-disulfide isomerase/thioredoxin
MKKLSILICVTLLLATACVCDGDKPMVHAILFYSPSCPHCHKVMSEDLPPLSRQYGRQLQILEVDTSTPQGQALFYAALVHFQIDVQTVGVPLMIVGDTVLRGDQEIPQELPGLIEEGLASGGIDWPAIPGFAAPTD